MKTLIQLEKFNIMKIICVGRNYVEHIKELNNEFPDDPIIFFKPSICKLEGSNFKMHDFSSDVHHEIEIIYKISRSGKNISISDSINYISGFNHSIFINSSLIELFVPNSDTTSTLPVTISAQRGGVFFDGELTHERTIEDSWISLPSQTFRPGYIQTAVSNHQILTNSSALDYVTLKISSSSNIADTIAEVTIDNLVNGGRFIQNSGAGILSLDTYNCSWDGENVVWSLESKWLLDDNSRLFWFVSAVLSVPRFKSVATFKRVAFNTIIPNSG